MGRGNKWGSLSAVVRQSRILGEFSRGARSHGVGYFVSIAVPLLLSSETGLLQGYPLYRGSKFVHRFWRSRMLFILLSTEATCRETVVSVVYK